MLNGNGMPDEWQTSGWRQVSKEKDAVNNLNAYRGVMRWSTLMTIVETVLTKRI